MVPFKFSVFTAKVLSFNIYLLNVHWWCGKVLWSFPWCFVLSFWCTTLHCVIMVVIILHILHFSTHQNHYLINVSRYEAHKPIGFHAPCAIRSCYDIAFDEYFWLCVYTIPYNCGWLVYVWAIKYIWIWIWIWSSTVECTPGRLTPFQNILSDYFPKLLENTEFKAFR